MRCKRVTGRIAMALAILAFPSSALAIEADGDGTPAARAHHQVVHHGGEERVYLIGGSTRRDEGYHYFDEVWRCDDEGWIAADPLPFPRSSHRVAYHAGRDSLVLTGGSARGTEPDGVLWENRDGEWRRAAAHPGAALAEPGMCYDRIRGRIVIFGGWNPEHEFSGETWEWDGETLQRVATTGPSPRAGHALVWDPAGERCLLFGGKDDEGHRADTWAWDGEAWERIETDVAPSPRWFFGAAADKANQRIVIFGGNAPDGDLDDTWAWDGKGWELLTREGPAARGMAKLAFHGEGVLLFGGRTLKPGGFDDHGDTWLLEGRTWVRKR